MVKFTQEISWENIEDKVGFDLIPDGDYICEIVNSEEKETKSKDGSYLKLTVKITEGYFEGRLVFVILNLWNASESAKLFAWSTLKKICEALGMDNLPKNDTNEMHGLPFLARIGHRKGVGDYGPQNEVKVWKPLEDRGHPPTRAQARSSLPSKQKSNLSTSLNDDVPF